MLSVVLDSRADDRHLLDKNGRQDKASNLDSSMLSLDLLLNQTKVFPSFHNKLGLMKNVVNTMDRKRGAYMSFSKGFLS